MIMKVLLFVAIGISAASYLSAFFLRKVTQQVDGDNEIVVPVINLYVFLALNRALALIIEFITLFFIDPTQYYDDSQRYIIAIQIIFTNFSWFCYCLSIIYIFSIIIRKLQGSLEDNTTEQLSYKIFNKMIEISTISIFIVFCIIIYPFIINDMEEIHYISFNFNNDVFYYTYILPDILNWVMICIISMLFLFYIYQMIRAIQLRNRRSLIKKIITHKSGRFYPVGFIGKVIIYLDLSIRFINIKSNGESYRIALYSVIIIKLLLEAITTPFVICLYRDILSNKRHSIQQTIDLADSRESKTNSSSKPSNIIVQSQSNMTVQSQSNMIVKSQDVLAEQLLKEESRKSLE